MSDIGFVVLIPSTDHLPLAIGGVHRSRFSAEMALEKLPKDLRKVAWTSAVTADQPLNPQEKT